MRSEYPEVMQICREQFWTSLVLGHPFLCSSDMPNAILKRAADSKAESRSWNAKQQAGFGARRLSRGDAEIS